MLVKKAQEAKVSTGPPRDYSRQSVYRYVRSLNTGQGYQARVPIGTMIGLTKGHACNLGTFSRSKLGGEAEHAAGRAAEEFARLYRGGDPWPVVKQLQARNLVSARVLPMWVRRLPGSKNKYRAWAKWRGQVIILPGPYLTPEAAHAAMRNEIGLGPYAEPGTTSLQEANRPLTGTLA
jgi:hypothetical protein